MLPPGDICLFSVHADIIRPYHPTNQSRYGRIAFLTFPSLSCTVTLYNNDEVQNDYSSDLFTGAGKPGPTLG